MKKTQNPAQKQLDTKQLHGFKTLKTPTPDAAEVAVNLGAKIGGKVGPGLSTQARSS